MAKKNKNVGMLILDFFSSYLLCIACLVILGLLVWFSTLEMKFIGLSGALDKYYSSDLDKFFVLPTINGDKVLPLPLPGAYWVCAVLFLNMLVGGLIRIRKSWRNIGAVISHFGIAGLLVVGFVDHHESIHSKMETFQGNTYDYTTKFDFTSIEVSEFTAEGDKKKPYVIKHDMIVDLEDGMRRFKFQDLPFDLEVRNFREHAVVRDVANYVKSQESGESVDGFFLQPAKFDASQDYYNYGCYVQVKPKNGEPPRQIILCRSMGFPQTFSVDGKLYGVEMPNEIWPMPFSVELINSVGEHYPGTNRPSKFQSTIAWTGKDDDSVEKLKTIKMNEPMRYEGFTLYQANWSEPINGLEFSGFEVVNNPADQWPKACMWISAAGLLIHFALRLFKYLVRETKKQNANQEGEA